MADKWKMVKGNVYRLLEIFDDTADAVARAREVKKENYVFISKGKDGKWAVYFRPKTDEPRENYESYEVPK